MRFLDIIFPLQDPVPIFTIVLFIILLAPILLRKLRIPSIIGLILAGMAIGDHGFNIIAKGSIDLFGKAGLLYIMFLAGLELDMAEFKKNTYKSLVFGFFHIYYSPLTGVHPLLLHSSFQLDSFTTCFQYVRNPYVGGISPGQQDGDQ